MARHDPGASAPGEPPRFYGGDGGLLPGRGPGKGASEAKRAPEFAESMGGPETPSRKGCVFRTPGEGLGGGPPRRVVPPGGQNFPDFLAARGAPTPTTGRPVVARVKLRSSLRADPAFDAGSRPLGARGRNPTIRADSRMGGPGLGGTGTPRLPPQAGSARGRPQRMSRAPTKPDAHAILSERQQRRETVL